MRALLIDDEAKHKIALLRKYAEAHRFSFDVMKDLVNLGKTAPPAGDDPNFRIDLERGFRVVYTQEYHPEPAGLCHHLSVSVDRPNKLPHPFAVAEIARLFGMGSIDFGSHENNGITSMWTDRENDAINIVVKV